ncbi:DUF1294 domain-containing protein [Exiguobacterium sp. FSL W8-0210]|uniref:DUF1294 domain-containing protein n=1 Tax=Exiguobacterium sp. FSL W8-0210 TaxID=2921598 RepID=UPI0040402343
MRIILGYYLLLTLIGFVSMWQDKHRAQQHAYRTPEATLLTIAFLGGALGSWIGMYTVRHKTRKAKFQWLVPIAAVLHLTFWFVYTSQ